MNSLISQLNLYFGEKAPALPANIKELIVKFGPYLIIISLIFVAMAILAVLPLIFTSMGLVNMMGGYYPLYSPFYVWASLLFGIAAGILQLMALPGLFKRSMKSWTLLFYGLLVSLVGMLVHMDLVSFVIAGLIGFYILFQIRSYYH